MESETIFYNVMLVIVVILGIVIIGGAIWLFMQLGADTAACKAHGGVWVSHITGYIHTGSGLIPTSDGHCVN